MLPLRSLNHNESAFVQFRNQTDRVVDIVWINYMGELQRYKTLRPLENVNVDTFKTHPWVFIDRDTGARMRVGLRNVYFPSSNREILQRLGLNQGHNFPIREPVAIRLPLFSLRQISLQNVFRMLKDSRYIDSLDLPHTLKRDIRRLYENKQNILSNYE